jgi:hypothetical protein
MVRYTAFVKYFKKKWSVQQAAHHLFTNFKNALHVVTELCMPMKLTKIYLNVIYSKCRIGKHLSNLVPIQNDQKYLPAKLKFL